MHHILAFIMKDQWAIIYNQTIPLFSNRQVQIVNVFVMLYTGYT
jgi:hypothetical protein